MKDGRRSPTKRRKKWIKKEKLGVGSQGTVWLVEDDKEGKIAALKESEVNENTVREAKILSRMKHPNIIPVYEAKINKSKGKVSVVMTYAPTTALQTVLGSPGGHLSEQLARLYFLQILGALDYVHGAGFVHKDVKLESMFFRLFSKKVECDPKKKNEQTNETEKKKKTNYLDERGSNSLLYC
jgi:eukaryotic-like serine/threonine-protein kinase